MTTPSLGDLTNKSVNPAIVNSSSILKVINDGTTFKQDWRRQASELPNDQQTESLEKGSEFSVLSVELYENNDQRCDESEYLRDYWKVTFNDPIPTKQGEAKQTWFVYKTHVELFGYRPGDETTD
jgi:hypothetical protein